jgi:hypothetical protein
MKTENIIRLGVMCYQKYLMGDNFKIMHVDGINALNIAFSNDMVLLDKLYFTDGGESAWVGYSKKNNILLVKGLL